MQRRLLVELVLSLSSLTDQPDRPETFFHSQGASFRITNDVPKGTLSASATLWTKTNDAISRARCLASLSQEDCCCGMYWLQDSRRSTKRGTLLKYGHLVKPVLFIAAAKAIYPAAWLSSTEHDPGPRNKESAFHTPPHINVSNCHVL